MSAFKYGKWRFFVFPCASVVSVIGIAGSRSLSSFAPSIFSPLAIFSTSLLPMLASRRASMFPVLVSSSALRSIFRWVDILLAAVASVPSRAIFVVSTFILAASDLTSTPMLFSFRANSLMLAENSGLLSARAKAKSSIFVLSPSTL